MFLIFDRLLLFPRWKNQSTHKTKEDVDDEQCTVRTVRSMITE